MALQSELETPGYPQNYYIIVRELIEIKEQIREIRSRLNSIEGHTQKMTNHVYFIEDLYEKVRKPFMTLLNKISRHTEEIYDTENLQIHDNLQNNLQENSQKNPHDKIE